MTVCIAFTRLQQSKVGLAGKKQSFSFSGKKISPGIHGQISLLLTGLVNQLYYAAAHAIFQHIRFYMAI
jgi:hypothetical protein